MLEYQPAAYAGTFDENARYDAVCSVDLDTLPAGCLSHAACAASGRVFDAHEYFTEVPEVTGRPVVQWVWEYRGAGLPAGVPARLHGGAGAGGDF
jgi:hypothetical protein